MYTWCIQKQTVHNNKRELFGIHHIPREIYDIKETPNNNKKMTENYLTNCFDYTLYNERSKMLM